MFYHVSVFFVRLFRINVNETESIRLVMRASLTNKRKKKYQVNATSRQSPHVRSSRSFESRTSLHHSTKRTRSVTKPVHTSRRSAPARVKPVDDGPHAATTLVVTVSPIVGREISRRVALRTRVSSRARRRYHDDCGASGRTHPTRYETRWRIRRARARNDRRGGRAASRRTGCARGCARERDGGEKRGSARDGAVQTRVSNGFALVWRMRLQARIRR